MCFKDFGGDTSHFTFVKTTETKATMNNDCFWGVQELGNVRRARIKSEEDPQPSAHLYRNA